VVTKHLEQLCEKEFALKQDEAYKGFDRELANLREHYAHHGLLVSSSRAQAVMDAALLRFDKILDGFENIYLAKFSDPARLTDEEDVTWLKKIVGEKMEPAIFELRTKVQSDLWEQSCALTGYWQRVESGPPDSSGVTWQVSDRQQHSLRLGCPHNTFERLHTLQTVILLRS
jgi:hypothetical protein